jgi:hypothetical protein
VGFLGGRPALIAASGMGNLRFLTISSP